MTVATARQATGSGAAPPRMDSPTRLWVMLLAAVIGVLLAGSVAAAGLSGRQSAAAHTDQATEALYSEVQDLSYNLADANATAATALLIGPVTPKSFTDRFNSDITQAEDLLSAASQRVTGDATASKELKDLAEQLPQYTQAIGQALANNRFGYPVAGAYLRDASQLLTVQMLPEVTAVINEQYADTTGGMSSASGVDWPALAVCVLVLALLIVVGTRISRATKRRANIGVLVAKVAVLALLAWTVAAAFGSTAAVHDARADFGLVAQAQSGSSQLALSETNVALQQIDRGEDKGQPGGDDKDHAQQALTGLNKVAGVSFPVITGKDKAANAYAADIGNLITCANGSIKLADDGEYQAAIEATVGTGPDAGGGGCEPKAQRVRDDLVALTGQAQQRYDADMSRVQSAYAGGASLLLPLAFGLIGAVAAAWGIDRRLAEFR